MKRSIISYGLVGAAAALVTFLAIAFTGLVSMALVYLIHPLGSPFVGTEAVDDSPSWLTLLIQGTMPSVGIGYIQGLVSAMLLVGVLAIPIFVYFLGSISSVLYEYTYSSNMYGVLVVGVKALITSLISGGVFLVIDGIIQLSGAFMVVAVLVAKWVLWGWVAHNITGVRIKGWS